jgi:hypothetical protein
VVRCLRRILKKAAGPVPGGFFAFGARRAQASHAGFTCLIKWQPFLQHYLHFTQYLI